MTKHCYFVVSHLVIGYQTMTSWLELKEGDGGKSSELLFLCHKKVVGNIHSENRRLSFNGWHFKSI